MQRSVTLPPVELRGPYLLTFQEIVRLVRPRTAGVYSLGEMDGPSKFLISYIGAGFEDVRSDLLNRIGTAGRFKVALTPTPAAAFLRQCQLFHQFRPAGNFLHPERPAGTKLLCPLCGPPSAGRPAGRASGH
jgi:hypothetical protein